METHDGRTRLIKSEIRGQLYEGKSTESRWLNALIEVLPPKIATDTKPRPLTCFWLCMTTSRGIWASTFGMSVRRGTANQQESSHQTVSK